MATKTAKKRNGSAPVGAKGAPGSKLQRVGAQSLQVRRQTVKMYDPASISDMRENPPFADEFVDTRAVAMALNLSASYFEKLRVKGGGPPFFKIGGAVRYRFGDVMQWVKGGGERSSTSDRGASAA